MMTAKAGRICKYQKQYILFNYEYIPFDSSMDDSIDFCDSDTCNSFAQSYDLINPPDNPYCSSEEHWNQEEESLTDSNSARAKENCANKSRAKEIRANTVRFDGMSKVYVV